MKLAGLFVLSLFLIPVGCSTPGLAEPSFSECVILGEQTECIDPETAEVTTYKTDRLIGWIVFIPADFAKLKDHHDALHIELNRCLSESN
jgi:hypothetical protein